jgi:excisionase family DNA binding protein
MLTVRDVMDKYQVNQMTVLRWIRSGELRALNVGRSVRGKKPRWRVPADAIAEFEARRAAVPAPDGRRRPRRTDDSVIEFYPA